MKNNATLKKNLQKFSTALAITDNFIYFSKDMENLDLISKWSKAMHPDPLTFQLEAFFFVVAIA